MQCLYFLEEMQRPIIAMRFFISLGSLQMVPSGGYLCCPKLTALNAFRPIFGGRLRDGDHLVMLSDLSSVQLFRDF